MDIAKASICLNTRLVKQNKAKTTSKKQENERQLPIAHQTQNLATM